MSRGDWSKRLERLYRVFPWPEELGSERLAERLREARRHFEILVTHPWVKEAVRGGEATVVDVCGGIGVGGVALASVLRSLGISTRLVVVDLRRTALERAKELSNEILGSEAEVVETDATEVHKHVSSASIALMLGYTSPHFSPYDLLRLTISVAASLKPSGVFVLEEHDRFGDILMRIGYRYVVPEHADEDMITLSIHSRYDHLRGVTERVFVKLPDYEAAKMPVRLWDLAGIAATLWAGFKDVDFLPIRTARSGFLIAKEPRGLDPEEFSEDPMIIRKTD